MKYAALLAAAPTFVVGVALLAIGAVVSMTRRVQSAGRFDGAVGGLVAVYGLLLAWRGVGTFGFLYPAYALYLVFGLFVLRRYYVLAADAERRQRDLLTAGSLVVLGGSAMVGFLVGEGVVLVTFLVAVPVSLLCGLLLLFDSYRTLRDRRVCKPDVASAVLALSSLAVYGFMVFWVLPRPAT